MSNAGIDGGGGGGGGGGTGAGVPPTTPPPTGHGSTRRLSHLSGSTRSGGAAAMGNVVGWLKQVLCKNSIDVNYPPSTKNKVY